MNYILMIQKNEERLEVFFSTLNLKPFIGIKRKIKLAKKRNVNTNGKLQQTGHSYFWVSDDDRKMILQFEFRLKIGTLYIKLDTLKL